MKVLELLGKGGFGNVELVEDEHGQQFARKTFSVNQPLSQELVENVMKRFKKEARIQKEIEHANLVPVISGNLEQDPPYYLMPVAESSLDKDISKDRTLGGDFIAVISDIVSALEELHSLGIYHRDLKPKNVLHFRKQVDNDEYVDYYAVSDFGLISLKESQLSSLTSSGMGKGSDHYTAPEITKDLRKASAQSDIYSLGCILHDMVGTEDRVPCAEIREKGPYAGIFRGCTRNDPTKRFPNVRAVLDALVSIGSIAHKAETAHANDLKERLESNDALSADYWAQLADFLEGEASEKDVHALLMSLSSNRIAELIDVAPNAAEQIGSSFAAWVESSSYAFEYCDGLANRLEIFVANCSFSTKVDCLFAMLEMGVSHNRWYVERKFFRLCNPDMDENLAKRMAVEFRVRGKPICLAISRLEQSINFKRSGLHPTLVETLEKICA